MWASDNIVMPEILPPIVKKSNSTHMGENPVEDFEKPCLVEVLKNLPATSHALRTTVVSIDVRCIDCSPNTTSMHIRLRQKTKNGGFATSGFHMAIF